MPNTELAPLSTRILGTLMVLGFFALLGFCLLAIVDTCSQSPIDEQPATVSGVQFTPSETSVGTGVDSNGNTFTTTTTSSEKHTVIVQLEDGTLRVVETRKEVWQHCAPGTKVRLVRTRGWIGIADHYRIER